MSDIPLELASVVFSKAGRDAGKFFAVIELVDDSFVKLADGELRRLEAPKLKKIKHLRVVAPPLEKIAEKLTLGIKIFDAELRSALRAYK
jgi:ribosomal protein L14E/L6E/L27E